MGKGLGVKVKTEEPNGNVAVNENEVPKIVKLAMPADLYAEYAELAAQQQMKVSELMLDRLRRCKTHSSIRSIYFHTSQLVQLENTLQKRPIESAEHALSLLKSAFTIQPEGFDPVPLSLQQIKRLQMGAYGGLSVQDHVNRIIQGAVSKATGV